MSVNSAPTFGDLSASIGRFVRFAEGTRSIEVNTTPGTACLGVLVRVYTIGLVQYGEYVNGPDLQFATVGAPVVLGDRLVNDASGRVVPIVTGLEPILGVAVEAEATIGQLVKLAPFDTISSAGGIGGESRFLTASVVDGATLTAAAAASAIPAANVITLPANFFTLGKRLRIQASGRISSVITTPGTARYDVRLAGAVVFDSLAILLDTVAAHVTVGWILDLMLTCRVIGATATLFGQGTWTCEDILGVPATAPKGVLSAILPWNTAPAVGPIFNSTAPNTLDLFFTQTVVTGSMTVHQYSVEALSSAS